MYLPFAQKNTSSPPAALCNDSDAHVSRAARESAASCWKIMENSRTQKAPVDGWKSYHLRKLTTGTWKSSRTSSLESWIWKALGRFLSAKINLVIIFLKSRLLWSLKTHQTFKKTTRLVRPCFGWFPWSVGEDVQEKFYTMGPSAQKAEIPPNDEAFLLRSLMGMKTQRCDPRNVHETCRSSYMRNMDLHGAWSVPSKLLENGYRWKATFL